MRRVEAMVFAYDTLVIFVSGLLRMRLSVFFFNHFWHAALAGAYSSENAKDISTGSPPDSARVILTLKVQSTGLADTR
jgi:hypothetical protein